jgi:TRAP transporter TAXI family solute receptor
MFPGKTALFHGTFSRGGRKAGMRGVVLRRVLSLLCLVLIGLFGSGRSSVAAEAKAAEAWLGLIAGPAAASETVLAADMASLFSQGAEFRVLSMLGDTGAGNLALLLDNPHVDIAFVSIDALAAATAKDKSLAEKLELVARLSPQEVHVLARADIGSLSDLEGKRVSFGPAASASTVTAASLFKALGLKVEALSLDAFSAIERLKQGTISAAIIVSGKPALPVSAVAPNAGIHLLPIPFGSHVEAAYLPTRLEPGDYPNLIQTGGQVATIATGMALLAARAKDDPGSPERVRRFVATVFPRFAELQAQGRHPKWREVNLAASLPGFKRTRAAEAWLAGHPDEPARPMAASAGQIPALPENLIASEEQKEALFKRFIEWRRGGER